MNSPKWRELLIEALTVPGMLPDVHSKFHSYSLGNRLWLMAQLLQRKMPVSPVASYNRWNELGRQVKKGEKALSMTMPRMGRKQPDKRDEESILIGFMVKNNWFSLEQTEGSEYIPEVLSEQWEVSKALTSLGIKEEEFFSTSMELKGYANLREMTIAISPLDSFPWVTRFHEMAHCLLHKDSKEMLKDTFQLDSALLEVEAESVAYLCCAFLGLSGAEQSRAYIQLWLNESEADELSEKQVQRIFGAADRILSAGAVTQSMDKETQDE